MNRFALLATLLAPSIALAQPNDGPPSTVPPAAPSTPPDKLIGVGYKLGDGIGFFGGDVIVHPLPHLGLDLYGTYFTVSSSNGASGSGYAFAPAVQGFLREGWRSTPYAAVGMQYAHLALGNAVGSGTGVFANLGYEWRWQSGFAIQLGGGVQYLSKITATSGTMTITTGGSVAPNLELGLRYMFL